MCPTTFLVWQDQCTTTRPHSCTTPPARHTQALCYKHDGSYFWHRCTAGNNVLHSAAHGVVLQTSVHETAMALMLFVCHSWITLAPGCLDPLFWIWPCAACMWSCRALAGVPFIVHGLGYWRHPMPLYRRRPVTKGSCTLLTSLVLQGPGGRVNCHPRPRAVTTYSHVLQKSCHEGSCTLRLRLVLRGPGRRVIHHPRPRAATSYGHVLQTSCHERVMHPAHVLGPALGPARPWQARHSSSTALYLDACARTLFA